MGAFGTGIFQDDFACDVRDIYQDLISLGFSEEDCLAQLFERLGVESKSDSLDYSTFWIALGLAQHKLGRLSASTKQKAIELIDFGTALEKWAELVDNDRASIKKRNAALLKAREKLLSPGPKQKKLKPSSELLARVDVFFDDFPWKRGQVYSYRLLNGEYVLLGCVVTWEQYFSGYYKKTDKGYVRADPPPLGVPFLILLDYRSTTPPSVSAAENSQPLEMQLSERTCNEALEEARTNVEHAQTLIAEDFNTFEERVKRIEPNASEEELRSRFKWRRKSAELNLQRYASPTQALKLRAHKIYTMGPKKVVPRERIADTGVSRSFLSEYRYYATNWEQLDSSIMLWQKEELPLGTLGFGIDPLAKDTTPNAGAEITQR